MKNYISSIDRETVDDLLKKVLDADERERLILSETDKENIILYGAGNLGEMAVDLLKKASITPKYIVDKSPEKWNTHIGGVSIVSPEDISDEDKENSIVAVCIVNYPYTDIKEYLTQIECKKIIPFWDIAEYFKSDIKVTNGWYCSKIDNEYKREIQNIYDNFQDNISRASYVQMLYWRVMREEILFKDAIVTIEDQFFPNGIMPKLTESEVFVDCGAYTGNSIERFMKYTENMFEKIISFEPDPKNYKILSDFVKDQELALSKKITTYEYGLGNINQEKSFLTDFGMAGRFNEGTQGIKVRMATLDSVIENERITILKLHVEGDEYKVLEGAMKTIIDSRPIIIITIYHSEEGIWKIPRLLMENIEDYSYYHRLHGYCGNESVLYAFPKERNIRE